MTGAPAQPNDAVLTRVRRDLFLAGYLSNGVGGLVTFAFIGFFVPGSGASDDYVSLALRNLVVFLPYLALTLPLGAYWVQQQGYRELERWLRSGRPAGDTERLLALRYPARWLPRAGSFWLVGTVLFTLLNLGTSTILVTAIVVTGVLGMATSCALQYLLVERAMRPIVAATLAGSRPPRSRTPGVAARLLTAWTLGAGIPLLGIAGIAATGLAGETLGRTRLAGACLFLAVLGLALGLFALRVVGRSVAGQLIELRDAVAEVEAGALETAVLVDDGSEVGLLQVGFNNMVAGLRERERLREAFGTYVDPVLTERVLREGVDLAGEEVDVSVFFLDVRDFTSFAERARATDVVARLNQLFELVVPIVTAHGGHANKFIGDGLLAVFGAPERHPDHAARAVASACEIATAIRARFGSELRVGIGVNSGPVVVGTVGGGGRLEFTVIGDAVNTAARVEAATRQTDDEVLITETTREQLDEGARSRWELRDPVPLKGKSGSVCLYAPVRSDGGNGSPAEADEDAHRPVAARLHERHH